MKVITENPIFYHDNPIANYSNLDGKSSNAEIKAFQNFVKNTIGAEIAVDGIWGTKTKAAWAKWGAEYTASTGSSLTPDGVPDLASVKEAPPTKLSEVGPDGKKKAGQLFDKAKGVWVMAKDRGIIDSIKGKLGVGNQQSQSGRVESPSEYSNMPESKEKPKWVKPVAIGAGLLIVGIIIYKVATSPKTAK